MDLFDILFDRVVRREGNRVFVLFDFYFYFEQFGPQASPWHLFITLHGVLGSHIQHFRTSYAFHFNFTLREFVFNKQHFIKSSNGRKESSNLFISESFVPEEIQVCEAPKETIKMIRRKLLEMRASRVKV